VSCLLLAGGNSCAAAACATPPGASSKPRCSSCQKIPGGNNAPYCTMHEHARTPWSHRITLRVQRFSRYSALWVTRCNHIPCDAVRHDVAESRSLRDAPGAGERIKAPCSEELFSACAGALPLSRTQRAQTRQFRGTAHTLAISPPVEARGYAASIVSLLLCLQCWYLPLSGSLGQRLLFGTLGGHRGVGCRISVHCMVRCPAPRDP
jgi:hypothetical protein